MAQMRRMSSGDKRQSHLSNPALSSAATGSTPASVRPMGTITDEIAHDFELIFDGRASATGGVPMRDLAPAPLSAVNEG